MASLGFAKLNEFALSYRLREAICLIIIMLRFSTGVVFGQNNQNQVAYTPPNPDSMEELEDRYFTYLVKGDFGAKPERDSDIFNVWGKGNGNVMNVHLNEMNPCTGCVANTATLDAYKIKPGNRDVPVEALTPGTRSIYQSGMNDTSLLDDLQSQNAVQMTTLQLTESAVAQGTNEAAKRVLLHINSSMATELRSIMATKSIPGYEKVYMAYTWCMQKHIKKYGFFKSQKFCANDLGTPPSNNNISGAAGLSFEYDPAYRSGSDAWSPGRNARRIYLLDYLFNNERVDNGNTAVEKEFPEMFLKLFGNIEFEIEGGSGPENPVKMIYKIKDPTLQPADAYKEIIAKRWRTLKTILKYKCDNNLASISSMPNEPKTKLLMELSVPGFFVNEPMLKPLADRVGGDKNEVFKMSGGGREKDCSVLDPGNTGTGPGAMQALVTQFEADIYGGQIPMHKFMWKRMFFFARLSALAEFLTKAAVAEQAVKHLTIGVGEAETKEAALDLIYRAIGTRDINTALKGVLDQLYSFTETLYQMEDLQIKKQTQAIFTGGEGSPRDASSQSGSDK